MKGIVFYASDGTDISRSFKLEFPCSNSEAEYEALITGLFFVLKIRIRRVCV